MPRPSPYVETKPNDVLTSDKLNELQIRAREELAQIDQKINNLCQVLTAKGGHLGVGTGDPGAKLTVVNEEPNHDWNTAAFFAPKLGPNWSHIHWGAKGDWYIRSAANDGVVHIQDSGGRVGIGIRDPGAKLTVVNEEPNHDWNTAAFFAPNVGPNWSHIHWGPKGDWYIRSAANDGAVHIQDIGGPTTVGGDIQIAGGRQIHGQGRLHIAGDELLYLLNKSGVIIGREWGGNGNLTVQGVLQIGNWTLTEEGPHLMIRRGGQTVARLSVDWDRLIVFQNLDGKAPYFYFNQKGDSGRYAP